MSQTIAPVGQIVKPEPTVAKDDLNAYQLNSAFFDVIFQAARYDDHKIVAIFKIGKSERSVVNKRRIAYVKNFLEKSKGWDPKRIMYAAGFSKNTPRIEFMLRGQLHLISLASKNMTPCLDCCLNPYFYPENLSKPIKLRF